MNRKILKVAKRMPGKARKAVFTRAEIVLTRSRKDFVPIRDGVLRSDSKVELDKNPKKIAAIIAYGLGPARAYALAVHENPSKHDPPTWRGTAVMFRPPGRGPQFLLKPLMEARRTLAKDLAKDLKMEKVARG